ncbi:hypothetical protein IMG5_175920, partial [Ichthyophthirius multifiliis]
DDYQKIFTIHTSRSNYFGGLEAYIYDQQLYYRVLYSKYTPPTEKTKGILLGQFNLNQWYFLALDHEGPKSFGRTSTLKILIDDNEPIIFSLEFPKIMVNTGIDQFTIGQNFIGEISSFLFLLIKWEFLVFNKFTKAIDMDLLMIIILIQVFRLNIY